MLNGDQRTCHDADDYGLAYDVELTSGANREKGVRAILDIDFIDAKLTADPANGCQPTGRVEAQPD